MISAKFVWKVVTIPIKALSTIIEYYTTGTIYSRTNIEFSNSLWKNIHLAIEYHLAGAIDKEAVALLVHQPLTKIFKKFRKHPFVTELGLKNYGLQFTKRSYWLVQNEEEKGDVLIFLHGGGYLLNIFESQFIGITSLYPGLSEEHRKRLSIIILEYSLTCHDKTYPTQVHEALQVHKKLVDQGYKNIHFIGDSAGGNLALAVSRFIAYPEQAEEHFKQFTEFDFNFGVLPQPKSLILVSPWVEPATKPILPPKHGCNVDGDLGTKNTLMGDLYVGKLNTEDINDWLTFTNTKYEEHWKNVNAINNGNTLVIIGEREVLRDGIEKFINITNVKGNMKVEIEKGGIHDCLFYVESLDFIGKNGALKAVQGGFKNKFCYNHVIKFLTEVMDI